MTLSVCVFCSSAGGLPEAYRSAARDLGAELAGRGHRLVYGGGNVGNKGGLNTEAIPAHGHLQSLRLTIPPLAGLILKKAAE